jgi:uncharacterized protein (DUF58 family)
MHRVRGLWTRLHRRLAGTVWLLALFALVGCAGSGAVDAPGVGYYWQSFNGHWALMKAARPVDDWLADPAVNPALKTRLALAQRMRRFAVTDLALPDNASRAREALEARARLSDDPTADFRSLREYVPGDDQRRIHWLSSARTGTVLVRDTFELRRATKTVVLETLDHTIEPALFEDAVEIAASLVLEAMRRQISVVARTRDRACPGRPTALIHREEALELFTRVRRTTEPATVRTARVLGPREASDQIIVIAGASSPLVARLAAAPALAGRVLVIRLAPNGTAPARLPIRSVDVDSVDQFLHRWRRGEVAA